jgi:hypothetical protein
MSDDAEAKEAARRRRDALAAGLSQVKRLEETTSLEAVQKQIDAEYKRYGAKPLVLDE